MKRKGIILGLIVLAFLLESTLFSHLSFAEIKPNLLIILTSSFGFMRGKKEGLWVGLVCGVFVDVLWGGMLGLQMLIFSVIGYGNGMFRRLFYDDDIKLPLVLIGASELLYGFANYVGFHLLKGDFAFYNYFSHIILPELIYTVLVTLVVYQVVLKINKKLEAEEQRSASRFV